MAIKVAFFSPLPPARSGIADYSAALLEELRKRVDVEVFTSQPQGFRPSDFDVTLYQIGNNVHHDFCYQTALEHPGVVVMHEANLHHLIADITIKRDDWDAYMRAVEEEGGPEAQEYARRVRALEVGPDYEGVPMLRRLLAGRKRPSFTAAASRPNCARPGSQVQWRASRTEPGFQTPAVRSIAIALGWTRPRR